MKKLLKRMPLLENLSQETKGGLSDDVFNNAITQNYDNFYGWLFHKARTNDFDKLLEMELIKAGFTPDDIANFIVSSYGRHAGDSAAEGGEKFIEDLPMHIRAYKNEVRKYGHALASFEAKNKKR